MKVTRRDKAVSDGRLNELLAYIERTTEVSGEGVEFKTFDFDQVFEILPDAFSFNPQAERRAAINMTRTALLDCRRAGPLTADALLLRLNQVAASATNLPLLSFSVWTKFRAKGMFHNSGFRVEWDGVIIRTASNLPNKLRLEEHLVSGIGRVFPNRPHGYGHVILSLKAQEERGAMRRAMEALQVVMGLINLFESYNRWSHHSHPDFTEGKLWLGPNQFVFQGTRYLGESRVWYNADYDNKAWESHPLDMSRVLGVMPIVRRALKALRSHPLQSVLVRTILLLQDGFSIRDTGRRLLRYWSALESLYLESGSKQASNQKVIARASFAELMPGVERWKLEHAANLRNEYAHAGGSDDDLQVMSQYLRLLLSRHLNHWIFEGHTFRKHSALLAFVDLPSDEDELIRLQASIERRLKVVRDIRKEIANSSSDTR